MEILHLFQKKSQAKHISIAEQIINQAKDERNKIIESARVEAADILAKAQIESAHLDQEIKWVDLKDEHQEVCDGLTEVRRGLQSVTELLQTLEDTIKHDYTQKIFSNLYELFELISDVRNHYSVMGQVNDSQSLTVIYNLNEFLDFICDILSVYGIEAYGTDAGVPFDGSIHMSEDTEFYPKTAHIAQSLRKGFRWGNTIMIKEKVALQQEECNVSRN